MGGIDLDRLLGVPTGSRVRTVMTAPKRLDSKFFQGDQNWSYESLWSAFGKKLKIHIRRNAYNNQSFAKCEIYNAVANQWNFLANIPHQQLKCLPVTYVVKPPLSADQQALFHEDEAELLRLAGLILG